MAGAGVTSALGDFCYATTTVILPGFLPVLGIPAAAHGAGLLSVGRNLTQVVPSNPLGAIADRLGPLPLLVAGYLLGTITATLTAAAFLLEVARVPMVAGIFIITGLFMAVQESLESAVTGGMVTTETIGIAWTAIPLTFGFGLAAGLMAIGTLMLARLAVDRSRLFAVRN